MQTKPQEMIKILMCEPSYFGIFYQINPWMDLNNPVDSVLAQQQWEALYQTIQDCGAQVELLTPVAGLPDLVFTSNGGAQYTGNIVLSHFKHPERQAEIPYFKAWFKQHDYPILNEYKATQNNVYSFEGAAEFLPLGDKWFAGYGNRSDQQFFIDNNIFDQEQLVYCELVNPNFYHLDSCFCPLNDKQAIWYPKAFSKESQQRMQQCAELIAVPTVEAHRFACNAVVINNHVILPTGCPETSKLLHNLGFIVHALDMSEFLKSGGACKCLTLRLPE